MTREFMLLLPQRESQEQKPFEFDVLVCFHCDSDLGRELYSLRMSPLLVLLVLGVVGMSVGFVISNSVEVEIEMRGRPQWDPPTCSSKYEDCIGKLLLNSVEV